MMKTFANTSLLVLGIGLSNLASGMAAEANAASAPAPNDPSFAEVSDAPGLPRVLLIGDSISMGYTVPVRNLLQGKANVHRIPENGGPTTNGLAKLKTWLGKGKWDVIHFNWGLHDLKIMTDGQHQVSPEAYEKNLRQLVSQLKTTGAKLIWATTTPVPENVTGPKRHPADVILYNSIAKKIVEENKIAIDDLYGLALPELSKIQKPVNVHFTDDGSMVLARAVVEKIQWVLPENQR
jgi:acyl-CoA thioesterase-1